MGWAELSTFILAPAARSCCNKYDSTWRPGGPEALSCHRAARLTGPIEKNNFLNVSVKHLTKKSHIYDHARENFFNVSVNYNTKKSHMYLHAREKILVLSSQVKKSHIHLHAPNKRETWFMRLEFF